MLQGRDVYDAELLYRWKNNDIIVLLHPLKYSKRKGSVITLSDYPTIVVYSNSTIFMPKLIYYKRVEF